MKTQIKTAHRCLMCKRAMTNPESITRGIGPECAEKLAAALSACGVSGDEMDVWEASEGQPARWAGLVLKAIARGNYRDARTFAEAARRAMPAPVAPVEPAPAIVEAVAVNEGIKTTTHTTTRPAPVRLPHTNQQSAWFYSTWKRCYDARVGAASNGDELRITIQGGRFDVTAHVELSEFRPSKDFCQRVLNELGIRPLYPREMYDQIIRACSEVCDLIDRFGSSEPENFHELARQAVARNPYINQ